MIWRACVRNVPRSYNALMHSTPHARVWNLLTVEWNVHWTQNPYDRNYKVETGIVSYHVQQSHWKDFALQLWSTKKTDFTPGKPSIILKPGKVHKTYVPCMKNCLFQGHTSKLFIEWVWRGGLENHILNKHAYRNVIISLGATRL